MVTLPVELGGRGGAGLGGKRAPVWTGLCRCPRSRAPRGLGLRRLLVVSQLILCSLWHRPCPVLGRQACPQGHLCLALTPPLTGSLGLI